MRVECLDPFVSGLYSVFAALTQDSPERGPLSIRDVCVATQQVTIALSVSGEIRANVLYGMSLVTAQKVAFELIGQPVKEMDERAWSAMDELSKILAKRCIDYADKSGFKCRIDSVSVLQGRGTDVASGGPALIVPLSTRLGRIVIDISIEEPALSEQSEAAARAA